MVQDSNPEDAICTIMNSRYDGAEAFGIQLECLKREYRTRAQLERIFGFCGGMPIYITSYRYAESAGMTDEECAELLTLGVEAGATLADIMGDMFCPSPYEITYDAAAVKKQKALADKIHALGGEVLFSSHLHAFLPEEEVFRIAEAQQERGADVVKIVSFATTEEELLADIAICARLKHRISKNYLFLANGEYSRHLRQITGCLGSCMYLCVRDYLPCSSKEQPILRAQKAIRDSMIF